MLSFTGFFVPAPSTVPPAKLTRATRANLSPIFSLFPDPSGAARGALAQAMGQVWYYHRTNPTMAAFGRTTLQRLIDDPVIPR